MIVTGIGLLFGSDWTSPAATSPDRPSVAVQGFCGRGRGTRAGPRPGGGGRAEADGCSALRRRGGGTGAADRAPGQ